MIVILLRVVRKGVRETSLISLFISVPDLIRELCLDGFRIVHAGQLLAQLNGSLFDSSQVEPHLQVGGAGAALHVEDTHGMGRAILEDRAGFILTEILFQMGLHFIV